MATIPGTPGDDFLLGSEEDDQITGLGGIDSYFWTVETGNESSSLSQDRVTDF